VADYVAGAVRAILRLLETEHAALWPEIEAKIAEQAVPGFPKGINPHHLSTARKRLIEGGLVEEIGQPTKGGQSITVLALQERRLRQTVFAKAAARKRALDVMYLKWTRASGAKRPNAIGTGGEIVARASLDQAASQGVGYLIAERTRDGVRNLLGGPVPGGPLDDGAYLTALNAQGRPVNYTVAIEVKNIRHWIYPSHWEIFQLLDKAARLQLANPDERIIPVLICRRAQWTLFTMAKDLGFLVLYTGFQPIMVHSTVVPKQVETLNRELAYNLRQTEEPHEKIIEGFTRSIPSRAEPMATTWKGSAPIVAQFSAELRKSDLDFTTRMETMHALREAMVEMFPDLRGDWLGSSILTRLGTTLRDEVDDLDALWLNPPGPRDSS
jgi:hypothetical protein